MNRKSFFSLFLLIPAMFLFGAAPGSHAGEGKAPRIFFPETVHDFGTISRGDNVSHVFKVRNTGDAPLRLIKAKGS